METQNLHSRELAQGSPNKTSENSDEQATVRETAPSAVRFASTVQEIAPAAVSTCIEPAGANSPEIRIPNARNEEIAALSNSLHGTHLAEQRMKNYSFQAFSLPASRVPSNDDSHSTTPQQSHSPRGNLSPTLSPRPDMVSPPLTPSGTSGPESLPHRGLKPGNTQSDGGFDSQAITPQASGQESAQMSPRIGLPHRPASAENMSQRTTAADDGEGGRPHRKGMFSIGPGGNSVPVSRESSPNRLRAAEIYSRPFTPAGDVNDPYAASKRAPQSRSAANIDQRFVFSRRKGRGSPGSSSTSLARTDKAEKRHSGFLGVLNKSTYELHPTGTESTTHSRQASMSDLRRFFKGSSKVKKTVSPAPKPVRPPLVSTRSTTSVPFADDHGLTSKYGKMARVLGSGAGGSVKLMKRNEDNTVFAAKEFRPRHSYETEKEYVKKLTAEFCIGSTLHHGNIIETLDIVQEKGKWYEVMEYAPYDLFAIVMTGRMSRPEVTCCFLQILSGVTYLHSMGLSHRDLKLDNVVVSEHGIMKIIDFGSAHVFKYPFENDIVPASGVVGSDPYLAPEVYDERKYDPQAVDIWSLAIIFCCMSLRRFPWKIPRTTDNSYKLFAAEPTPGHDPRKLVLPSKPTGELAKVPSGDMISEEQGKAPKPSQPPKPEAPSSTGTDHNGERNKEVIRGPWRLLRLLPRESRHIIYRMLMIDPRNRAKMSEILEEPWVSNTVICRQVGPGSQGVVKASDHTHVLEPPAPAKQ
ncbi:kinase-like domain-containing protein [Pseudomassariella vexata]|uniref:non-specific serine/threonine protein kinase n=1 Tax=Pseudomassariella vexata TaxID=1141098 RepID=A0A1Y2E2F4_9PEZI|nr:kinase-like domain-containing protein [Pseudomassariella vexata]ORY65045.1 kinase-like domain-containing protein [Pseudomassariella vexata]